MQKVELTIKRMHCNSCAMLIEDALNDLGVKNKVDSKKEQAVVEFDENKVSLEQIKATIKKEGYQVK